MYRMSNIFNFLKYVDDIYFITVCIMMFMWCCRILLVMFSLMQMDDIHTIVPVIKLQVSRFLKLILDAWKMLKKISWGAAYKPWGLLHYRAKSKMAAKHVQGLYKAYIEKTIILIILYLSKNKLIQCSQIPYTLKNS